MSYLKNWDKNNWLSSRNYIKNFNKFILNLKSLNKSSRILDIGCGRGKIIGDLKSRLKLKFNPLGIDIVDHKDKDKRINFLKINAKSFFLKNKDFFDLIIIKQTIHLIEQKKIKSLINNCKKRLNENGKILIFSLDPNNNELPTFGLMKERLDKSLKRDKKIFRFLYRLSIFKKPKKFSYKVRILKTDYINMIKKKYISILLTFSQKQIDEGIKEINHKYKKKIKFNDNLLCIIIE